MHRFPRNPERRRLWEIKVKRASWKAHNNSFLCDKHFDDSQREMNHPERPLKWNAVPNIFAHTKRVIPRLARKPRPLPALPKFWNELDHPYAHKNRPNSDTARVSLSDVNMDAIIQMKGAPHAICPAPVIPIDPYKQIHKLETQNLLLKRKLRHEQRLRRSMANERTVMQKKMMTVFNNNQIENMSKSSRSFKWSRDSYRKALKLRNACGKTGYQELLRQSYPLPSLRSLRRKEVVALGVEILQETMATSANDNQRHSEETSVNTANVTPPETQTLVYIVS
ncbi:uncharacterized protein LOC130904720 isoform X2 [Corythoichthys intestinalis]|nr:uncharacterized protein LOC130904720 isoform X2 [Corythoichthys intestinalis]